MTRQPTRRNQWIVSFVLLITSSVFLQTSRCFQAAELGGSPVAVQFGVRTKMRDGITLVSDIYRPNVPGKFPALLQRTPYNRAGANDAFILASHGYVVIVQDTRGRFDSEGEFYPFKYESEDGYDTVEWASGLEYVDGHVGMFGGSYVGATQMLASMARPPHLEAIFPYVTASEYYDGWTYQSGALMQWFASSWGSGLTSDTLRRKSNQTLKPLDWVNTLPVDAYPLLDTPSAEQLAPYFTDWINHENDDQYWKRWKVSDHYADMNVKGLHGAGWHDIFVKGSIKNFMGLREAARSQKVREGQRLLIGPWAHAATSPEGKVGDVVFGKQAVLDITQTAINWFDYALKGETNQYATGAPVRIFVLGENVWRDEQEFPLKRAVQTRFYLGSQMGANGRQGDGKLSNEPATGRHPDVFYYDPQKPVPTIGGRLCCGNGIPPGPSNQAANENRSDVLIYSTPSLAKEVEVTGFISVELYASSSAEDTDFTAMLVDVDADGYARYLADGVVRARYRNTLQKAEPIIPNQIYKYTIDLWATSNLFKAGHQIRLYISSSNFPRFNRNLNTGDRTAGSKNFVIARQTIYHEEAHPSALVVPIVPR